MVDEVRRPRLLRRYTSRVSLRWAQKVSAGTLHGAVSALETELRHRLERSVAAGGEIVEEEGELTVHLPELDGGAKKSAIRVERKDGGWSAELELLLHPTVFTATEDSGLLEALRDEVQDDAGFLLQRALGDRAVDLKDVGHFEATLGTIKVQDQKPLPLKVFRAPKRGAVLRRAR